MKRLSAFALIEASLLGAGAGADRMVPEEIPTWAIWLFVAVCLAGAAILYWWDRRDDKANTAAVRKAIQAELKDRDYRIEELREVVKSLPQEPLGDGHTYAALPDGTNIVTRADGSYRLALPIHLGFSESITIGDSLQMEIRRDD